MILPNIKDSQFQMLPSTCPVTLHLSPPCIPPRKNNHLTECWCLEFVWISRVQKSGSVPFMLPEQDKLTWPFDLQKTPLLPHTQTHRETHKCGFNCSPDSAAEQERKENETESTINLTLRVWYRQAASVSTEAALWGFRVPKPPETLTVYTDGHHESRGSRFWWTLRRWLARKGRPLVQQDQDLQMFITCGRFSEVALECLQRCEADLR